jgi:hypothetical protein
MSDPIANTLQHDDPRANLQTIPSVPEDVLREIFAAVVDTRGASESLWDADIYLPLAWTPFSLSHVCAAWRSIALDYKELWCIIDLNYPRLAELCIDLSRPRNIHVFCKKAPKGYGKDPDPEFEAELVNVLQDSTRIESLRLSYGAWRCYHTYISPTLTEHQTDFPNLRALTGGLPWAANSDAIIGKAPLSLQELHLIYWVDLPHKVLCSLQLVTLKIPAGFKDSVTHWRIFFKSQAPTLKHLVIGGDATRVIDPPIVLPFLQTLLMTSEGAYAGATIRAPRARCITLQSNQYDHRSMNYDRLIVGCGFARAIRQRFRGAASSQQPFHLRYNHDTSIILSNPDIVFRLEFPFVISVLVSICQRIDPGIRKSVTCLELNVPQGRGLYGGHKKEQDVIDHDHDYRIIVTHLPSLEEIWLDAICADDFLPWLVDVKNRSLCSSLRVIQLSNYGQSKPDVGGTLICQIMDSFTGNGQPIHLILKNCNVTIDDILRAKGHFATVVNDEVKMSQNPEFHAQQIDVKQGFGRYEDPVQQAYVASAGTSTLYCPDLLL